MNRLEAWTEYGQILNDAIDWLRDGYRRRRVGESGRNAAVHPEISAVIQSSQDNGIETPEDGFYAEGSKLEIAGAWETAVDETGSTLQYGGELRRIAEEIARCERCNLHLIRENTVPGVGTENPLLMIVTAAPVFGARETDGPLPLYESDYLDKWLRALNLRPGLDTFVLPAVKCRTPGGRPPSAKESGECFQYLKRQFAELRPRAIMALGAAACAALTGNIFDFPSLVGKPWTWEGVPSLILWTPAEVLENPARLRKPVWDALQRLKDAWNALPETGV